MQTTLPAREKDVEQGRAAYTYGLPARSHSTHRIKDVQRLVLLARRILHNLVVDLDETRSGPKVRVHGSGSARA